MNREWLVAGMAALGFHALLLFGFRVDTTAMPLPAADSPPVDVDLVAAAAAPAPAAAPAEPPPETPPLPPPPPPEPTPPPEPIPAPETKPPPREPIAHHETPRPLHPSAPAPRIAGPASTARNAAVAAGGVPGGVSSPIRPRYNPKPPYPPEAKRLGQQGRVLLEVQVGTDGHATSVSVKRSSGFPVLDSAAAEGVQRWTFEPARVGGLPISSRAEVPVNFSLAQ